MRCPVDNETLVMADRNGVEIDYCPKCRGVWLDRGELDKIIERAAQAQALPEPRPSVAAPAREMLKPASQPPQYPPQAEYAQQSSGYRDRRRDDDDDDDYGRGRKPYRKRESFLSDLFDF